LESYLSDQDFTEVFGMPRTTFNDLPLWKRNDMKKKGMSLLIHPPQQRNRLTRWFMVFQCNYFEEPIDFVT
jgi:hypothetical protein